MSWPDVRTRWPDRPVDIHNLVDGYCYYDFGHIPSLLFARKLREYGVGEVDELKVRRIYWRLQHDLFGEYAYTVHWVQKGAPFAIPVTCYGDDWNLP